VNSRTGHGEGRFAPIQSTGTDENRSSGPAVGDATASGRDDLDDWRGETGPGSRPNSWKRTHASNRYSVDVPAGSKTRGDSRPTGPLFSTSGPVRVRRSCSNSRARRESRFALRSPPRVLITVSKMRAALQSVRTPGLMVTGIVGTRSCPPRPGRDQHRWRTGTSHVPPDAGQRHGYCDSPGHVGVPRREVPAPPDARFPQVDRSDDSSAGARGTGGFADLSIVEGTNDGISTTWLGMTGCGARRPCAWTLADEGSRCCHVQTWPFSERSRGRDRSCRLCRHETDQRTIQSSVPAA
jgi:hypothetical protein